MKKAFAILFALMATLSTKAQDGNAVPESQRQIVVNITIIIFLYIASSLILRSIKSIQDYRLKMKMIERGLPDEIVQQFLKAEDNEFRHQPIKFFIVLAGSSTGLILTNYLNTNTISTIAVMGFSVALSFLAYFFYLKRSAQNGH